MRKSLAWVTERGVTECNRIGDRDAFLYGVQGIRSIYVRRRDVWCRIKAHMEAPDQLQEHPTCRPDKVHVCPLRDKDLLAKQELVMQHRRRQRQTSNL